MKTEILSENELTKIDGGGIYITCKPICPKPPDPCAPTPPDPCAPPAKPDPCKPPRPKPCCFIKICRPRCY